MFVCVHIIGIWQHVKRDTTPNTSESDLCVLVDDIKYKIGVFFCPVDILVDLRHTILWISSHTCCAVPFVNSHNIVAAVTSYKHIQLNIYSKSIIQRVNSMAEAIHDDENVYEYRWSSLTVFNSLFRFGLCFWFSYPNQFVNMKIQYNCSAPPEIMSIHLVYCKQIELLILIILDPTYNNANINVYVIVRVCDVCAIKCVQTIWSQTA